MISSLNIRSTFSSDSLLISPKKLLRIKLREAMKKKNFLQNHLSTQKHHHWASECDNRLRIALQTHSAENFCEVLWRMRMKNWQQKRKFRMFMNKIGFWRMFWKAPSTQTFWIRKTFFIHTLWKLRRGNFIYSWREVAPRESFDGSSCVDVERR